ncbi:MAG TPA: hypothetical protein GYA08_00715 [Chloroflexi bacterium]|nr:hypothetical protein [Chloroflexota bacterium]
MTLLATIVLSVALWWPGGGMTQSDAPPLPPPFCGELSDADCQLLADAQELMRGVASMNMTLALDAGLSGIPDFADEDLAFGLDMDMTMHLNPALNEEMRAITARPPEELLATLDEFSALVIDFYKTLALGLEMEVALPRALRDALEIEEGVMLADTLTINVRMVDGYAYIDMDALAASFPDLGAELAAEGIEGWIGVDFVGQMERELEGAIAAPDISTLQSMQLSMAFNQLMMDETMRSLLAPYVVVERLTDEERDGAPVAVFRTTLELGKMVANPNFTRLLREAADTMAAAAGEEVDAQELGTGILGVQLLATMLARSAEFEIVQTVGLDAPYTYDNNIFMQLDLSSLIAMAAMGGGEVPDDLVGAKPILTFDMNASYSDFDAAPAVEAPENVEILPLDSMDGSDMDVIS